MFSPMPWMALGGRVGVAVLLGAMVGWERELDQKAAGLRTNMLVSLGSALFVLVAIQSGLAAADPSSLGRCLQGVITGVGFVGAGSILREKHVRGLTSAAAVWVSAGLGMAAGLGQWPLGLMAAVLSIVILRVVKRLEHRAAQRSQN
ncbi:MAG: MgtC/SapB family protein [Nodosilinea sp.]